METLHILHSINAKTSDLGLLSGFLEYQLLG